MSNTKGTHVYFVQPVGGGLIKIGLTCDPEARLRELMIWSPVDLQILVVIPGNLQLEQNIHDCFLDAHERGEWFKPIPRLTRAISLLKHGVPVGEAIKLNAPIGSLRSKFRSGPARAASRRQPTEASA